jgi:hypothetical protein
MMPSHDSPEFCQSISFLHTDNFWRDFDAYKRKGVVFVHEPVEESYGTVAVFKDLYGNLWDLLQLKK